MGSNIPLPALAANPPQVQDPLAEIKNVLALRNIQQQGQTQQLQQQAYSQENQQRQLGLDEEKKQIALAPQYTQKDESGKVTGFDQEGYYGALLGNGVRPGTVASLKNQAALVAKNLAEAGTATQALQDKKNSDLGDILESVRSVATDPNGGIEKANQAYQMALPKAAQVGLDISKAPTQFQTVGQLTDFLNQTETGLAIHKQLISNAKDVASTRAETAKAGESEAATAQKAAEAEWYKANPGAGAPGVPPTAVEMGSFLAQHPGKTPADFAPYQAAQTEKATLPFKEALSIATKKAEQAISDGDPKAAAQLLIDGTVAPSQIISSRKPAFAQEAFTAAAQMKPGWNAQKADADYKVAGSPQQVAFFGSAKSLTDKGGTLDQLADAAKDIPANQLPVFNTVSDAIKASTGSGPIAKYAALALGVADDYAKVMGGGQGSDTSRTQAMNIIAAKQSPEQRAASIEGIRGAVNSQANSRIGNNPVLQKMYGGSVQSEPKQAGGKSLTMQAVEQAAKDHGVSVDEAKRQAQAAGYSIAP